jgi:DNA-binding response OmpR family regulator
VRYFIAINLRAEGMKEIVGRGLILVVEDDDATRAALVEALAEYGYSAAGAKTFGAAKLVLRRIAPAAIVLDLGLPDGDGASLLRHLRASNETRLTALPVLVRR